LYENVIPWAISALSLLFVILTYVRNGNKDRLNETKEEDNLMNGIREGLLKANMKLDQVCTTTNETRTDIKSLNKDLQNLDLRVAMVEKDLKNAFHQIDELNHRVSEN
jgi:septal ring factor EnvC (AmiA/AmiB activator)